MSEEVKSEVTVPEKFQEIVKQIESMSVLELSELVKVFEAKFGVTAAAPMMMAAPAGGGASGEAVAVVEKTAFNVELTAVGEQKIAVIKAVKEIAGLGLKDAKDLVEKAPAVIKENVPKAEAEEMKKKIETAGGKVELK
jgi:large subunit ribosomal protein L7/L12